MTRPIILITAGRHLHAAAGAEQQGVITGTGVDYVDALVRAGGTPLILPCVTDEDPVESAVGVADAVLLTGGGDVISLAYGEEPDRHTTRQDAARDAMEIALCRRALDLGLPVLGICRGIQVLNVALGGTLIQDIPTQVSGALLHSQKPLREVVVHTLEVEPGSLMARLFGTTELPTNSYHHQAVKDLGEGLRVTARARDGVVEAVEAEDGRPVLGVQFHPEESVEYYPRFRAIFNWLVDEARQHRERFELTTEDTEEHRGGSLIDSGDAALLGSRETRGEWSGHS